MKEERIALSQRERERLKVLHEVERGHLTQGEVGGRLPLSPRQIRRLLTPVRAERDGGAVHRLRGRPSNRKIAATVERRILAEVRRRYVDFGPTLAAEHLARGWAEGESRNPAELDDHGRAVATASPALDGRACLGGRRAAFSELVMMDTSPFAWLEERGPPLQFIALIDDATSRIWEQWERGCGIGCGAWGTG